MNKYEFINRKEFKENAYKYFKDFFQEDLSVSKNCNLKKLRGYYIKYCKEYFTKFGTINDNIREDIIKAYTYMESEINTNKKLETKSNICNRVRSSYDELLKLIANYSFKSRWLNSYGDTQNKANKAIILDISLLRPILENTLYNIDQILNESDNDDFKTELIVRLEREENNLKQQTRNLKLAMNEYHDTWDFLNGRAAIGYACTWLKASDLGEAKKDWRKKKNEACHEVLKFYENIELLNRYALIGTFDKVPNYTLDLTILLELGLENIKNSPYYYSYLNNEEKNTIEETNKVKKLKK
jgi:hypothetical protein